VILGSNLAFGYNTLKSWKTTYIFSLQQVGLAEQKPE